MPFGQAAYATPEEKQLTGAFTTSSDFYPICDPSPTHNFAQPLETPHARSPEGNLHGGYTSPRSKCSSGSQSGHAVRARRKKPQKHPRSPPLNPLACPAGGRQQVRRTSVQARRTSVGSQARRASQPERKSSLRKASFRSGATASTVSRRIDSGGQRCSGPRGSSAAGRGGSQNSPPPVSDDLADEGTTEDDDEDDLVGEVLEGEALTPEESQAFTRFFSRLDRMMDGSVPISELITGCNLLDLRLTEREIRYLIHMMHTDSEDTIQVDEFLEFMSLAKASVLQPVWNAASGKKMKYVMDKVLGSRDRQDYLQLNRRSQLIHDSTRAVVGRIVFRGCIEAMRQLLATYWGVAVPLFGVGSGYRYDADGGGAIICIEVALTIVALADIAAHVRKHGVLASVQDVRTWADFCAAQPLDIIGYAAGEWTVFRIGSWLRFLAVVKLLRRDQFHPGMGGQLVTRWSVRISLWALPVLKQLTLSFIGIHLLSCLFISSSCTNSACDFVVPSWAQYLEACYWTLYTLSSVGYGDIPVGTKNGQALAIFGCVMTIFVNGWLVGKVASHMLLDPGSEHRLMLSRTMQVITAFHVPEDVIEDVLSLQNHLLEQKLVLKSFTEVVDTLPPEVQELLGLYVRVAFLSKIPLFAEASAMCKVALAEVLSRRIVPRNSDIVIEGEVGYCMYVIVHGFAEVYIDSKGQHVATLTRGSAFGEMALLSEDNTRAASVRSLTLCEILSLSRVEFDRISARFPALRWHLEVIIATRKGLPPPPFRQVATKMRRRVAGLGDKLNRQSILESNSPSDSPDRNASPESKMEDAIGQHLLRKHAANQGRVREDELASSTATEAPAWVVTGAKALAVSGAELEGPPASPRRKSGQHHTIPEAVQGPPQPPAAAEALADERRASLDARQGEQRPSLANAPTSTSLDASGHGLLSPPAGHGKRGGRGRQPYAPELQRNSSAGSRLGQSAVRPSLQFTLGEPADMSEASGGGVALGQVTQRLDLLTAVCEAMFQRLTDMHKVMQHNHRVLAKRLSVSQAASKGAHTLGFTRSNVNPDSEHRQPLFKQRLPAPQPVYNLSLSHEGPFANDGEDEQDYQAAGQ